MCVDPDWMPFERITENGIHEGMAADLLAMMQQRSGVSLELLPTTSWSESIAMAKSRQCDIFSLAMATPERREYMDFTTPYLSFPFVIATRSDKVFIDRIERVLDKPLALVKGYAYTEILKKRYPDATFVEVDNLKTGFQLLRDGEVYGYIDALAPIAYTIQNEGMSEIKIAGKFDDPWELAIGTRKDEPLLLTIMQKMTDTLTKKEKRESYNTWFSIKFESATNYSLIWKILLGALALFIVFLYWNLKLHASKNATQQALEELGLARNQLEEKNRDLVQALEEVKQLSGILPICCQCKQVRNDKGYWQQVEQYVSEHSEAKFSHGLCPACYEKEMARIDTWGEKADGNKQRLERFT